MKQHVDISLMHYFFCIFNRVPRSVSKSVFSAVLLKLFQKGRVFGTKGVRGSTGRRGLFQTKAGFQTKDWKGEGGRCLGWISSRRSNL